MCHALVSCADFKAILMLFGEVIWNHWRWLWTSCTEFFKTLPKVASHLAFQKFDNIKQISSPLVGHTVAMVTYCVKKIMCSPMIRLSFWYQVIKSGHNDPSASKCWKLFWVLNHQLSPWNQKWPIAYMRHACRKSWELSSSSPRW